MRRLLPIALAAFGGGGACDCNSGVAACDQTLIALCEYDERCFDGPGIEACIDARPEFTCTVDVAASAVCVDAINEVLRRDCADPPADLPCPLLTQSGLYEPCGGDLVCASERECLIAAGDGLCSQSCAGDVVCPEGGGCSVDESVCGPGCGLEVDFLFECASTQVCVEGRCRPCAEECDGCDDFVEGCDCAAVEEGCGPDCVTLCETCDAVVEGCDCAALEGCPIPCVDDTPCGGGVCTGGFCA